MTSLYHFTDTVHLPWVLQAGKLSRSNSTVGGYPKHDFLWAISDHRGCRSANNIGYTNHIKAGRILLVRFTLHAEDFEPWRDAVAKQPLWLPEHIKLLEWSAREMGDDPAKWYCRDGDLARDRWISIHARSWRNPTWYEVPLDSEIIKNAHGLGVRVQDHLIFSNQVVQEPTGTTAYQVKL